MTQTQRQLLEVLTQLIELHPEQRLGQLISNMTDRSRHPSSSQAVAEAIWEIEDEELLASIREHVLRRREQLTQTEPAA